MLEKLFATAKNSDNTTASRLRLHEPATVYFLREGSVDIFAVETRPDPLQSPHLLLATLTAPALLFGFPHVVAKTRHMIYASLHPSSKIASLPIKELQSALLASDENAKLIAPLLDRWIDSLSAIIQPVESAKKIHWIEESALLQLEMGELASPKRPISPAEKESVTWIRTLEGKLLLAGQIELPLSPFHCYPLAPHQWVTAAKPTQLRVIERDKLFLVENGWEKGLISFHEMVLRYLEITEGENDRLYLAKAQEKKERERADLDHSLRQMGSLLLQSPPVESKVAAPLLRALLRVLGDDAPQLHPSAGESLEEISLSSHFRYRKVALPSHWWQKDCGPLLGFYEEGMRPVTLLFTTRGMPTLYDPIQEHTIKVTAKIAQKLAPFAYTFQTRQLDAKDLKRTLWQRHRRDLITLALLSAAVSLLSLSTPVAIMLLYSLANESQASALLWQIGAFLGATALFSSLFYLLRGYTVTRLEVLLAAELQTKLWDRLLNLPLTFFRKYSVGNLTSRAFAIEQMRARFTLLGSRLLLAATSALGFFAAACAIAPKLTLYPTLVLLLGLGCLLIYVKQQGRKARALTQSQGALNGLLVQLIGGIAKLRTAGAETRAFIHWSKQFASNRETAGKLLALQRGGSIAIQLATMLSLTALFAVTLHSAQTLPLKYFLGFYIAYGGLILAVLEFASAAGRLPPVTALWDRMRPILEAPTEEHDRHASSTPLLGNLSVDQLSFRYYENAPLALDGISLHAKKGELVALVGPSGCGKTTLIQLLLGFYPPTKGAIYYEEQDSSGLDMRQIRQQMGVVLQQDALFGGSLWDNITCGRSYTYEEVMATVRLVGLEEDLARLPMGIHTLLAAGSGSLSGGQKQKIYIARALIGRPKMLILDEATSACDSRSCETIAENLQNLDITRIIVTHRLKSLKNADRIYVMNQGKIVDEGRFDDLASRPGLFSRLLQA